MTDRRGPRGLCPAVLVVGVIAMTGGGPASAFWHVLGAGSGSVATATVVAVTLSPGTSSAGLYPGGQASVALTVSNPNTSPVVITSLGLDTARGTGGYGVDAGHAGCSVAALSLATQTNGGAGWTVPGKVGVVDGSLPIALTNALAMSVGAANACQGGSFTVYLSAGP